MRQPRKHAPAGFTLIEVMLTLVIMSGIMLTIAQILTAARTSRDTIHNIQEQQLAGPAILEQLANDLRALTLYDRDARLALRVQNHVSAGFDADSIDFVATTDGLLAYRENANSPIRRADINEVGYRLRPNPDHDDFLELYRREDFAIDDEPFDGGEYAFLHDRVKSFEVRIYEEDGLDAEPLESWGGDSDEYMGIPARIEVELTLELAPRLVREQLVITRHTVTYKRVFRFSPSLARVQEIGLMPLIPRITKPVANTPGAGAGFGGQGQPGDDVEVGGGGGGGGGGGRGGGGGGEGTDSDSPFGGGR